MSNLDEKYYMGFEGSPEIVFSLKKENSEKEKVGMWVGYFNNIIEKIEPEDGKWTGLAYYHHLDIGWHDESPWLIENLTDVYEQLNEINSDDLGLEEKEILEIILNMLKKAIYNDYKVFISYD